MHIQLIRSERMSEPSDEEDTELLLPRTIELANEPSPPAPAGALSQQRRGSSDSSRVHYVDWLRVLLTAVVIVHHAFYIYGFGWWPYYGYWLPEVSGATVGAFWTLLMFDQVGTTPRCTCSWPLIRRGKAVPRGTGERGKVGRSRCWCNLAYACMR